MKKVKIKTSNHTLIVDEEDIPVLESLSSYENMHNYVKNARLERDKAVRKQVCDEIRKKLYYCGKTYLEDEPCIEICIIKGILDQIEKGE